METSAKASVNVEEAFHTLARDIKTKTEKKLVSLLKLIFIQIIYFLFIS
jgi:GTPase SAR1 family protein